MKFKVAVVQFEVKQFEPEKNLIKAEKFIQQAKEWNSDLIIFPEDFITWPILSNLNEFADWEKKYCKFIQNLAKRHKINIIPWSIIEKITYDFIIQHIL